MKGKKYEEEKYEDFESRLSSLEKTLPIIRRSTEAMHNSIKNLLDMSEQNRYSIIVLCKAANMSDEQIEEMFKSVETISLLAREDPKDK